MNALARLFKFGADDADRRVAAALAPRDHEDADRYLLSSATLGTVDRATQRLESWWSASEARRALTTMRDAWGRERRPARYQAIGGVLLVAAATHVALMVWRGSPPGPFWLFIPAMAAAVGVLLLAAARSADFTT